MSVPPSLRVCSARIADTNSVTALTTRSTSLSDMVEYRGSDSNRE